LKRKKKSSVGGTLLAAAEGTSARVACDEQKPFRFTKKGKTGGKGGEKLGRKIRLYLEDKLGKKGSRFRGGTGELRKTKKQRKGYKGTFRRG